MISFELSAGDQKLLEQVRKEALVCRNYARYYDENEHEFPPDELPEAKDHGNVFAQLMKRDELEKLIKKRIFNKNYLQVDNEWYR